MSNSQKTYWLDKSENVAKLYRGLWVVGLLLVAIDLILPRHEDFGFATLFGFYGLYGFFACVILVLVAKRLRTVLMHDEDYYDR